MGDPTHTESWADEVLAAGRDDLSSVARHGFREHGPGAVFVWQPVDRPGECKMAYVPAAADALQRAGSHPKEKVSRYDPVRELVAVFVGPHEDVYTVLAQLTPESSRQTSPEADG